jgi:MarR-like DNA-binding transcriptional regulator SgrR of sgrS sRNA
MTIRDDTWDAAFEQLLTTGEFKLTDLPFNESERHTVRRVLREMENKGWLQRETGSSKWRVGKKAELLMQLDSE